MSRWRQPLLVIVGIVAGFWGIRRIARHQALARQPDWFAQKVILITGASRGIGYAMAIALARRGAYLVLGARSVERLAQVERECRDAHPACQVLTLPLDVADVAALDSFVQAAIDRFGRIDVLINNAGVSQRSSFDVAALDAIDAVMNINLRAAMRLTRLVLPAMLQAQSGTIVNIASFMGRYGFPFAVIYSTSKAGLIGFGEALRRELHRTPIRVVTINPGFTRTDMIDEIEDMLAKSPLYVAPTEVVVARTLEAIVLGEPEVTIGWFETAVGWTSHLAPRLADEMFWQVAPSKLEATSRE